MSICIFSFYFIISYFYNMHGLYLQKCINATPTVLPNQASSLLPMHRTISNRLRCTVTGLSLARVIIFAGCTVSLLYTKRDRSAIVSWFCGLLFHLFTFSGTPVINVLFFFCKQLPRSLPESPFPEASSKASCWCCHRSWLPSLRLMCCCCLM